jgi:uncharacterized repeat protein (TIGR02543 family)
MKRNGNTRRLRAAFAAALSVVIMAVMLLVAGCKDLFHPEGPEGGDDYYTVTFNADGGGFREGNATQTRLVNSGVSIGSANMPSEPTRSGYAFGGWYTSRNGAGTQFTSSTRVNANITVYAKWTAATATQRTVTFNLDGGDVSGSTASLTRLVDSGASIGSANMPSEPTRSGYTFGGWYTSRNGAGTQFTSSTTVTADITVYAKWTTATATQRTVTFNLDGGDISGNIASLTRLVDIGVSIGSANMPPEPTRSGYAFGGWYTSRNGAGTQFTFSTTVTADITVYAKWTTATATQRTVTFNLDGGNVNGSTTSLTRLVDNGASIGSANMPPEPTKGGYAFGGWYTSRNGAGTQFTSSTTVSANITVYAKWELEYPIYTIQIGLQPVPDDPPLSDGISNIAYSSVSGGAWTLQGDGRRKSPSISHGGVTKSRVSFTSATANASITIQLDVSSESGYDYAFISQLDNADATYNSGYYTGSRISGEDSVTITIPIPTAGDHFIDIGYRKDGGTNSGADCAWFTVIQSTIQSTTTISVNESAQFSAGNGYASYAWYWNGQAINGETASAYTLAANSKAPGVYELSVVVTTNAGELLSARRWVVVRAY